MNRTLSAAVAAALVLATAGLPAANAAALTAQEQDELTASYAHLVGDFYKKVDTRVVVDGARANLLAYLKAKGVSEPRLPAAHATGDQVNDVRELQREVQSAVTSYGAKLGAKGPQSLTYAAIAGALSSVKDKYTTFLTPEQYAELNQGLDGASFGGVGLTYEIDEKSAAIHVDNVIPGGPADKAGLSPDDLITAIDGKSVKDVIAGASDDQKTQRLQKLLRGEPGTKVRLEVTRDGKAAAPVTVTREEIHQPSVYAKLLPGGIGYAQVTVFGASTGTELTQALTRLDAQGAKAYVLDLRYNGGGYLAAAIDVSSKFIATGPIVTVEGRMTPSTQYDAENTAVPARPLAVLVNQYTASASEITAGAIEDSGVGTIIGTKTYGKGVVQTIFPMRDGSAVKITTARYLTPSGRDINGQGIPPQVVAEIPKGVKIRQGDLKQDPQLVAAVDFVSKKLAAQGNSAASTSPNASNGTNATPSPLR